MRRTGIEPVTLGLKALVLDRELKREVMQLGFRMNLER